jgi:uncharacterized protein YndB with AHSA1/START domain
MYHFVTNWSFEAPVERVWAEIADAHSWPDWWPSYRKVTALDQASTIQVGSRVATEVKGKLPYSLRFTGEVTGLQAPYLMEIKSSGALVGEGKFVLEERDGGTAVTYYWDVGTANPVLNLLARLPFVRAMIEENHDYVMDEGFRGLKQRLAESRPSPQRQRTSQQP